ncbi:glycerophosphoryl diester phosphodiesterase membrane domain-containing protein [Brachybacterium sp. AOP25-B2-12]|uniref:glycerophosphoryl diester phosphodiesterase membrane domain-containing protein n=1 Tax=Brachybacterium sp. AOP25-B2-12 TaxID=3457710 RepID=UPI00403463A6
MSQGWIAPGSTGGTQPSGPQGPSAPADAGLDAHDQGQRAALRRELVERTPLFPLRPLGVGEILGAATRIYRLRTRTVLAISAIVFGIAYLLSTVLAGAALMPTLSSMQTMIDDPTAVSSSAGLGDGEILMTFLTSFASASITLVATQLVVTALAVISIGEATGARVSDGAVWRIMVRRGLRAVVAEIVVSLVSGIAALILVGLGLLPVLLVQEAHWWTIVPIVLGALAALLLLLYVRARAALTTPALAVEDLGPLRAIGRSLALTRGRRVWRVLGIWLLLGLIAGGVAQVVSGTLSTVGMVAYFAVLVTSNFTQLTLAMAILLISSMIAGYLATVLIQPFSAAGVTTLYADERMRHEAWDIELDRAAREHRAAATAHGSM